MTDLPAWTVAVLALAAPTAGLAGVWLGQRMEGHRALDARREAWTREDQQRWDDRKRQLLSDLIPHATELLGEAVRMSKVRAACAELLRDNPAGAGELIRQQTALEEHGQSMMLHVSALGLELEILARENETRLAATRLYQLAVTGWAIGAGYGESEGVAIDELAGSVALLGIQLKRSMRTELGFPPDPDFHPEDRNAHGET